MSDVDGLSSVPPHRRAEVARRVAALRAYHKAPSRPAAIDAARSLGVGLPTFYKMAKAWRELGDPSRIAGAGCPRVRRSTMNADQIAVVERAVAMAPAHAPDDVVGLALAIARKSDVAMPDRSIIRRRVLRTRPAAIPRGAVADGADLAVDQCVVDLPVRSGPHHVRPLCSFLIDVRARACVGLAVTLGPPTAAETAAALLNAAEGSPGSRTPPRRRPLLDLRIGADAAWTALSSALGAAGLDLAVRPLAARGSGDAAMGLFGALPGIRLMPRLLLDEPRRRLDAFRGPALTIEQADELLRARLEVDARRATVPLADPARRDAMLASLRRIIDDPAPEVA